MTKEDFKTILIILLIFQLVFNIGYTKGLEENADKAIQHYKTRVRLKEETILILDKTVDYLDKKLAYQDSIINSK